MWVDKNYSKPVKKILVVGMAKEKWQSKAMENELKTALKSYNVEAIVSWRSLPKDETISKETFDKYFKDKNIDAVLIVRSLGATTDETVVKGGVTNVYAGYYGFYLSTSSMFIAPDYVMENKTVHVDAHIFDTKTGNLIFKTTSQSFDPHSYSSVIKEISNAIVGEIEYSGLIKK